VRVARVRPILPDPLDAENQRMRRFRDAATRDEVETQRMCGFRT
jgi:hypothetical protein